MTRTLYGKLALALAALLVAVGLAYVLAGQALTRHHAERLYQQLNRDLAYNLVAERRLVSDGRIDEAALKETFSLYMTINPSIEIYRLDLDGNILTYSAEPSQVKRSRVSLAPIRAFLGGDADFPLLGDDPRSHDRRKSFSVTPVPSADAPEGFLYVVLRGESYDALERLNEDSLLLRLSLWTLAGSLLIGLLAGLLVFYLLTRRLRRLTALMSDFRDSRFSRYQLYQASASGDEIDQLGSSFNQMARRMQAMLHALAKKDALRRELVNNVSHDLRTPLTCLHGYLETLKLKGAALAPNERAHYLDMALGHSQRLGSLIAELFELAKLDARAVRPNSEPFSAAELLQDVGQKFQLAAAQKDITIHVDLPRSGALAYADVGLIERVLENLIVNALEHTPPGGRLYLQLLHDGETLRLTVQDTGAGIAPEDLPHVFERSYRGGGGGNHAGLGLAIASRIVALHGGELTVASRPREGTRFSFDLPLAG